MSGEYDLVMKVSLGFERVSLDTHGEQNFLLEIGSKACLAGVCDWILGVQIDDVLLYLIFLHSSSSTDLLSFSLVEHDYLLMLSIAK